MKNRRIRYLICLAVVLIAGAVIFMYPRFFPAFILRYGLPVLWPAAIYFLLGLIFPAWRFGRLATWTLLCGAVLICIRFVHIPVLDALCPASFDRFFLSGPFRWSLLICYLAGTYIAVSVDGLWVRRKRL